MKGKGLRDQGTRGLRGGVTRCVICLLVFVAAGFARGQDVGATRGVEQTHSRGEVALRAMLSAGEITTADRLILTLEVAAPRGANVTWPAVEDALGVFTVSSREGEPSYLDEAGRFVTTRRYTLEPMIAGEHTLPTLRFDITTAAGGQEQIVVESMPVRVQSLLPQEEQADAGGAAPDAEATAELGELRGVVAPERSLPVWAWLLILLGTFALLGLALVFVRIWRVRPEVLSPPDEVARRELETLLAQGLIERQAWDEFFSQLSAILRRYIEARFGLHAPERTTEEFLQEARTRPALAADDVATLDRFLRRADQVKFAAAQVTAEETRAAAEEVRDFIENTRSASASAAAAPSIQEAGASNKEGA